MSTHKECDVIPLFPDQDDDSATAGWDPYIFSIISDKKRTFAEDRRRMPRPLNAERRRALLLSNKAKGKKKTR